MSNISDLVTAAKARLLAAQQATAAQAASAAQHAEQVITTAKRCQGVGENNTANAVNKITLNTEQQQAYDMAMRGQNFVLTGAAGTGKTTCTQTIITNIQQCSHIVPLSASTKHLMRGAPAIVICGYTNKAVNNIRKKLPKYLQAHCITMHKLIEFMPVYYDIIAPDGSMKKTMRFEPSYHVANKLPHISTIIYEEASMIGTDLFQQVIDALPHATRTQHIFLGDINQLPPIFGQSILGFKLIDLPVIELIQVYRQALKSPIIALATAIRKNRICDLASFGHNGEAVPGSTVDIDITHGTKFSPLVTKTLSKANPIAIDCGTDGTLIVKPYAQRIHFNIAQPTLADWLCREIDSGSFLVAEDMVLIPWNQQFGTIQFNKYIAQHISQKAGQPVQEVIARGQKTYWAIGDKVFINKLEGFITKIEPTIGYAGRIPALASLTMNRDGKDSANPEHNKHMLRDAALSLELLETGTSSNDEEQKNAASHTISIYIPDTDETVSISTAGDINNLIFAYALTVHKSQGSEWRKVVVMLHALHNRTVSRELLYTAVTRASKHLVIFCEADIKVGKDVFRNTIQQATEKPEIVGDTLEQKLEFFKQKLAEQKSIATQPED